MLIFIGRLAAASLHRSVVARLPGAAIVNRAFSVHARTLPETFPSLNTVADVTAAAELLYTPAFIAHPTKPSISHITSLYQLPPTTPPSPNHTLHTLRIDAHAPRSPYDWFALNLSRARAELIVLTGAILRDEPLLTGNVLAEYGGVLGEWRREVWGRERAVAVCVLTAGPVDFNHPLFSGTEGDVFVYTTSQYFQTLHQALQAHGGSRPPLCSSASSTQHLTIPLRHLQALTHPQSTTPPHHHGSDRPIHILAPYTASSLPGLLTHFRRTHPAIAVECGPSTTLPYYWRCGDGGGGLVDSLLLSVYSGELRDGGVGERCVVPGSEVWERLGWRGGGGGGGGGGSGVVGGGGGVGDAGFALTSAWVAEHYDSVSVARQGDWRFEWHRSKHRGR